MFSYAQTKPDTIQLSQTSWWAHRGYNFREKWFLFNFPNVIRQKVVGKKSNVFVQLLLHAHEESIVYFVHFLNLFVRLLSCTRCYCFVKDKRCLQNMGSLKVAFANNFRRKVLDINVLSFFKQTLLHMWIKTWASLLLLYLMKCFCFRKHRSLSRYGTGENKDNSAASVAHAFYVIDPQQVSVESIPYWCDTKCFYRTEVVGKLAEDTWNIAIFPHIWQQPVFLREKFSASQKHDGYWTTHPLHF